MTGIPPHRTARSYVLVHDEDCRHNRRCEAAIIEEFSDEPETAAELLAEIEPCRCDRWEIEEEPRRD